MAKIKGWKKVDENVWRRTESSFPRGSTYDFVWAASNNTVRATDSMPADSDPIDLVNNSYVLFRGRTWKQTRTWVVDWMREHPG